MYVRLKHALSPEELQSLRNEFMHAMSLTGEDFYVRGPLIVVPEHDRECMPIKDDNTFWIDVNVWDAYYGPGYERGDPQLFVKYADWLEQRLPGSEIYYGHDVGDENVSLFDRAARKDLLDFYRRERS